MTLLLILSVSLFACGTPDDEEPTNSRSNLGWVTSQIDPAFKVNGIACNDNTIIAVSNGGRVAISTNRGSNWRAVATNSSRNLNDIARCGSHFMAVGDDQTILWSIDNGSRWTPVPQNHEINGIQYVIQGVNFQSIACNGSKFVTAGQTTLPDNNTNYDNITAVSETNGASWRTYEIKNILGSSSLAIPYLFYGDGYFYLATDEDSMGYSTDGMSWDTPSRTGNRIFNPTGLTSGGIDDNGTTRTIRMMSQNARFDNNTITLDDDFDEGRLFVSYDDIEEWGEEFLPTPGGVYGVAFGRDKFIAVSQDKVYSADNFTDNITHWVEDNAPRLGDSRITTVTSCSDTFWVGTDRGQIFSARY
jgi:hypothetical protein